MSAIFGFVYFDGRPAPPNEIKAMAAAMAGWGPDGLKTVCAGSAAFGHALLAITPESRHEAMPYANRETETVLTAAVRLDNRDDMCDLFGVPAAARPEHPDGRLVMQAYERWREEAPEHLFGDWSFAVWKGRERNLFVARDHLGNTGLYYYRRPPLFVFASSVAAVLAHPSIPRRLDEGQLAAYLTIHPRDSGLSSFYRDIQVLPSAHALTVVPEKKDVRRYWYLENTPAIRLGSDREYLDGFLDHFRRAVRTRLRSNRPVGTTLSAGLDSGSVTALAAEALGTEGRGLRAFTAVPIYPAAHLVPGALADEWPLAQTVAKCYGNIEHLSVRAEKFSPLAALRLTVPILQAPPHAVTNMFWILAILDEARHRNVGVLLTGQLGNGGVSWSGGRDRIAWLLTEGRWKEGLRSLMEWKHRQKCSWTRALRHHLLRPFFQPLGLQRRRAFRPRWPSWSENGAIHPDFARRQGLMDTPDIGIRQWGKPMPPLRERQVILMRNGAYGGLVWHACGSAFGLEVRDPTADVRLLEYCMAVPDEQYTWGGGERMLLRRAMNGLLPDLFRWNVRRGRQGADAVLRLLACRDEVIRELEDIEDTVVIDGYLDVAAMRRAWEDLEAVQNPRTAQQASYVLLRGLAAGIFLKTF